MLSVKVAVRQIGIPNAGADIFSPEQVEQDFAYKYSDYVLQNTHYLGEVKDSHNVVLGYKVMFVFVKNEVSGLAGAEALAETNPEEKVKRGRPKGS